MPVVVAWPTTRIDAVADTLPTEAEKLFEIAELASVSAAAGAAVSVASAASEATAAATRDDDGD